MCNWNGGTKIANNVMTIFLGGFKNNKETSRNMDGSGSGSCQLGNILVLGVW
jgi:hypothetical protein